jgi:hypothetical protein
MDILIGLLKKAWETQEGAQIGGSKCIIFIELFSASP